MDNMILTSGTAQWTSYVRRSGLRQTDPPQHGTQQTNTANKHSKLRQTDPPQHGTMDIPHETWQTQTQADMGHMADDIEINSRRTAY